MKDVKYEELFFSKVRDFLSIYLERQCGRSQHTVKSYKDSLSIFRRYVLEQGISIMKFTFSDCSREFLLGFMEYLQHEGYEKSTCNQRLAAIKSYMWYVADGDIEQQQTALAISHVPFLRDPEKEKETINSNCLRALFEAPGKSRIGVRDTMIMILLYDSAIRLSELLALKISDINLSRSTPYIRVHGKGDRERIISISDRTADHLSYYINMFHNQSRPETEFLFYTVIHGKAGAMSPGNVERLIKKYAAIIRPEHPELPAKVHPHMFRRTRATDLYQNDVDLELVSRILGHASTQTTRIYAKPSLSMIQAAMEASAICPDSSKEPEWLENEDEMARLFGLR